MINNPTLLSHMLPKGCHRDESKIWPMLEGRWEGHAKQRAYEQTLFSSAAGPSRQVPGAVPVSQPGSGVPLAQPRLGRAVSRSRGPGRGLRSLLGSLAVKSVPWRSRNPLGWFVPAAAGPVPGHRWSGRASPSPSLLSTDTRPQPSLPLSLPPRWPVPPRSASLAPGRRRDGRAAHSAAQGPASSEQSAENAPGLTQFLAFLRSVPPPLPVTGRW